MLHDHLKHSAAVNPAQDTSLASLRPLYEGANIQTWIGFKQLMYMVEEAVLRWFRERKLGPQFLFHELGLGLEIVDSSLSLLSLVEIDDEVIAETTLKQPGEFAVRLLTKRNGSDVLAFKAKVKVALIHEKEGKAKRPVPESLDSFVFPNVEAATTVQHSVMEISAGKDIQSALCESGAFFWSWRARYFHCHYSDRVQHSAYVRALEELVDRFLADGGISVARMLRDYGWIPVVSKVRVELIADAFMEETIHAVFTVEQIMKDITYEARMDCYVQRGTTLIHTATARILHGYAISRGEKAGSLTGLDGPTLAALTRGAAR